MKYIFGFLRGITAVLLVSAVMFVAGSSVVLAQTNTPEPITNISETNNTDVEIQPTPTPSNGWTCTVNGRTTDCSSVKNTFLGVFVVLMVMFFAFIAVIAIFSFVVWIIMLVHAITNPIDDKALWIVLMIIVGSLVSFVYYFAVKRPFDKQKKLAQAGMESKDNVSAAPTGSTTPAQNEPTPTADAKPKPSSKAESKEKGN